MNAVRTTDKRAVSTLLEQLPDDVSLEDIQYHVYVLEKVRRAEAAVLAGETLPHSEAKARMQRWLSR